eukprot:TRINITY_DN4098_c0_g1_i3.p1 TRINITY_DN4098_c0_g1~~TRINITY_DN4098_c0_g1_i3.p1  ORF type:complete len:228 (-),score=46.47 TRINITY_DN4098_c0_g1_i3:714-1397(-)
MFLVLRSRRTLGPRNGASLSHNILKRQATSLSPQNTPKISALGIFESVLMSLDSPNQFPQYSLLTSPVLTLNYLKSIPNYPLFKTFSFCPPGYNLLYSKTGNPPPRTFSTNNLEENFVDLGCLANLNMDKLIPLSFPPEKRENEHGPREVPAKLLYLLWGDDDVRPLTQLMNVDIKNNLPKFFTGAYQQDAMDITIKFTKLTIYQSGDSSPIHRELPRSPKHCGHNY